jgi:hypothetical protein
MPASNSRNGRGCAMPAPDRNQECSVMTTLTFRAPLRQRPAGLLTRLWHKALGVTGGPRRPRPGRLRLEALSDAARRDLGLPPGHPFR